MQTRESAQCHCYIKSAFRWKCYHRHNPQKIVLCLDICVSYCSLSPLSKQGCWLIKRRGNTDAECQYKKSWERACTPSETPPLVDTREQNPGQCGGTVLNVNRWSFIDLILCLCVPVWVSRRAVHERTHPQPPPGSSTSNILQIELRFSDFLAAGSQWLLRERHRWPICLHFAPELLNTAGELLCGWHRAAHRHTVGCNGHFHCNQNTIANIIPCSLSHSLSLFSEVNAIGFSDDKGPFVFNLLTSTPSTCQSRATRTDQVYPLLLPACQLIMCLCMCTWLCSRVCRSQIMTDELTDRGLPLLVDDCVKKWQLIQHKRWCSGLRSDCFCNSQRVGFNLEGRAWEEF